MTNIKPFKIDILPTEIEDLKTRLTNVRWPDTEPVDDWSQGLPTQYHKDFCDYWANEYDWFATQNHLNQFTQYVTNLDGLDIHFIHVKSSHADAKPLLITHGWPGSIVEFHKVIEPLTEPTKHGGSIDDACHVICPSLPGYGFSEKPSTPGWNVGRIAAAWDLLMSRLGYENYYAQGGDWGAGVTTTIGMQNLGRCKSIHVNLLTAGPTKEALTNPSPADTIALERAQKFRALGLGYHKQQSTRPQTIGYALSDSPVGQSAWILEKFHQWTDCDGHPENIFSRDELIDNIMLYWLTNSGASSARLYWETFNPEAKFSKPVPITLPAGASLFPKEIMAGPRSWSEQLLVNIQYWNEVDRGGHFAAFEQPEIFVEEMRNWLRAVG
jgi:pimeloyl-ACP methyl ester carboxylesterase